jgi:hypothetical protein
MLVQQIDPTIIVAIIGVVGAILTVGLPYVFTRNKEVDLIIRQEKTKRYDELIGVLIKINDITYRSDQAKLFFNVFNNFAAAYLRASTYSSDDVLKRCNDFNYELRKPETDTNAIRRRISDIYGAIRRDINPKAKYSKVWALSQVPEELTKVSVLMVLPNQGIAGTTVAIVGTNFGTKEKGIILFEDDNKDVTGNQIVVQANDIKEWQDTKIQITVPSQGLVPNTDYYIRVISEEIISYKGGDQDDEARFTMQ